MTFKDIQINCWKGVYVGPPNLSYKPCTLPETTVIDENQSVKWNKAEIKKRNEQVAAEWNALYEIKKQRYQQFKEDMRVAAITRYGMNNAQFEKLYEFVRFEYSSADDQCTDLVEDFVTFCDFFFDVVNTK